MSEQSAGIWVCVDCMLHHANGECGNCREDHGHDREPWDLLGDGEHATMGMLHELHDEDCIIRFADVRYPSYDLECSCEVREFSWSSCGGCGSMLGGSRYAFTVWWDEEDPLDKARALLEPHEPVGDDYRDA